MIQGTRRWLRRNRTTFAIGAGVLGAGYVAGQYVLGKISEARMRMSEERVGKEKYVYAKRRLGAMTLVDTV
jgi:peroxin-3